MSSNPEEDGRKWTNIQNVDHLTLQSHTSDMVREIYGNNVPSVPHVNQSPSLSRYPSNNLGSLSENYSVLPVGQDYFLKVYHNNENEQPTFNNYELFSSNSLIPPHNVRLDTENNSFQSNDTTNMIINQLVTNWSPNFSGTYSPFGEQNQNLSKQQQHQTMGEVSIAQQLPTQQMPSKSFVNPSEMITNTSGIIPTTPLHTNKNLNTKSSKTNGSFENNQNNFPEKKRIVAEVKPMRMSYSDVLSKNVEMSNKINAAASGNNFNGNTNNLNPNSEFNVNQGKNSTKFQFDKNKNSCGFVAGDRKSQNPFEDKDKFEFKNKKNENNLSTFSKSEDSSQLNGLTKEKKKSFGEDTKDVSGKKLNNGTNKKSHITSEKAKLKTQQSTTEILKKRSSRKGNEFTDDDDNNKSKNSYKEYFYNVTAKTNDNIYEKPQKYPQNLSTKKSRIGQKTAGSSGVSSNNSTSNASFRSERQSYSKRGQKQRRDLKYELVTKFVEKWFEYTIKILTWLFYLIYDVVVLSFGMAYDRVKLSYHSGYSFLLNLHKDLKQNSGKPSEWIKNLFKKIDNKFKKNSKWAFWRQFNKKQNEETFTDFYKNGRLPQTGDEAMYSLLNCKGKDAYSILGVSSNSSQEQVRKHYKKIAVLVHPDKNKQPGAEEAFKVLQRAFELIGEPENRKSYDQSLVEALNAEKAWSELHDLLSQLQSKIAEAANTIRCSSCGLRHPRKLTDRPHYAARECSSCKIRHSAREGDIWAETTVFGLRWKYLALMDGKCYDITEWANCQKGALSHLKPNSHIVQYRIVRGGQQQNQQPSTTIEKEKLKREPPSEPSLDDFLDNLYSGQNPQNQQQQNCSRRRSRRN